MSVRRPYSSLPAIVITGASSGIGREIARVAASEGRFMLLIGRSEPRLASIADEIKAIGAEAAILPIDLRDPGSTVRIDDALSAHGAYCDVLVNSAGFGRVGAAVDAKLPEQLGMLDINARVLTELTLHYLPGMRARGRGGVMNVGSITGLVSGPNMAVYYASKAYVRSFTSALAAEMRGTGVTVSCLAPGVVRTRGLEQTGVGGMPISKLYPRMDAAEVAETAWKGFRQGRRMIIPGWSNRAIAAIARLIPDAVSLRLIKSLQQH